MLQFTERCERVLVAAAGYTRNRRQRQQNSLTTTAMLYALIDFALLNRIDADDATRVIGNAVREAGVEQYDDRRKRTGSTESGRGASSKGLRQFCSRAASESIGCRSFFLTGDSWGMITY